MPPKTAKTTTPDQRITRLLNEGVRILAVYPGDPGIDITHDIVGLLEALRGTAKSEELASATSD